jgi:hypothetical protein
MPKWRLTWFADGEKCDERSHGPPVRRGIGANEAIGGVSGPGAFTLGWSPVRPEARPDECGRGRTSSDNKTPGWTVAFLEEPAPSGDLHPNVSCSCHPRRPKWERPLPQTVRTFARVAASSASDRVGLVSRPASPSYCRPSLRLRGQWRAPMPAILANNRAGRIGTRACLDDPRTAFRQFSYPAPLLDGNEAAVSLGLPTPIGGPHPEEGRVDRRSDFLRRARSEPSSVSFECISPRRVTADGLPVRP